MISKRAILVAILTVVIAFAAFGGGWYLKPTPVEQKTVALTIRTAFTFWGSTAHAFVALDKGYFAEEGLSVTILRGFGSTDNVRRLVTGTDPIVEIDPAILTKGIVEQGVKARFVLPFFIRVPWAVCVWKDSGINSPKDLEGKKVGLIIGAPDTLAFPFFLKKAGVDISKVELVNYPAGSGLNLPALFEKKIDARSGFAALTEGAAIKQGIQVKHMYFSDYGLLAIGNGWAINEEFMKQNPQLVKGFVKAIAKGLKFAFSNPEEAARIQIKYQPELDLDVIIEQVKMLSRSIVDDVGKQRGIGYMSEELQTATRDLAVQMYNLKTSPSVETIFTNEFNPGITP